MKIFILLFLLIGFSLAGCGKVSESTLKEVLGRDPSFNKAMDIKNRLDAKILDLEEKKQGLDGQISLLRQEINPEIQALREKLQKVNSEYKLKAITLRDSLSKAKNIRRLLAKKAELTLSGDEISAWNKRISDIESEIDSTRKDLDRLQSQIRLIKTEIKILKK